MIRHPSPGTYEQTAAVVRDRLARNVRIRRNLPHGGRLRIDRQLPFLCVYRTPAGRSDPGTSELVTSEAAYLVASGSDRDGVKQLLRSIAETLREHFGMLLYLEIWAMPATQLQGDQSLRPEFEVLAAPGDSVPPVVDALVSALRRIRVLSWEPVVTCTRRAQVGPADLPPLLDSIAAGSRTPDSQSNGSAPCVHVGLAVRPIFQDAQRRTVYPVVLEQLRRQLSAALRQAIFAFTGGTQDQPDLHFDSLGPTSLVKAAWLVDQQLSQISESFDFLLQVTPVNSDEAWRDFQDGGCRTAPRLHYRPLPYHPSLLKRQLFDVPIERVEDPTLAHLYWQKQSELDRQLTTLRDIGLKAFRYGSLQLYGRPDEQLVALARQILHAAREVDDERRPAGARLTATEIAARAQAEIAEYHRQHPHFTASVEVCNHIAAGLMVTGNTLYVSDSFQLDPRRIDSLLHHEVGTHLLTYFNGRQQRFHHMYAGLVSYEGLQEGLAVLAEYFTGGLRIRRLRVLAARVLAVQWMLESVPFPETYGRLVKEAGLSPRAAFATTVRAYRGGGLTKDYIYLLGLRDMLQYLAEGHDLHPLFVGKIGLQHVPAIQELRRRGLVQAPALLPRYMQEPDFPDRLQSCRGKSVLDLLNELLRNAAPHGDASISESAS